MKLICIEIPNHSMNMCTFKGCEWYRPTEHNQCTQGIWRGSGNGLTRTLWNSARMNEKFSTQNGGTPCSNRLEIEWLGRTSAEKTWEPWGTTEHKPAAHPGSEEGQKPPELCDWELSQLIGIIYLSPLLRIFKMVCRILCLVLDPQRKADMYTLSEFSGQLPQ